MSVVNTESLIQEIETALNKPIKSSKMDKSKQLFDKMQETKLAFKKEVEERMAEEGMKELFSKIRDKNIEQKKQVEKTMRNVEGGKRSRSKRYEDCTVVELKEKAVKRNIKGCSSMRKAELIRALRK